jgi:hypothetical protein
MPLNIIRKHELEYESEWTNFYIIKRNAIPDSDATYPARSYLHLHFYTGLYLDKELVYICFSNNLFVFSPEDDRMLSKQVVKKIINNRFYYTLVRRLICI